MWFPMAEFLTGQLELMGYSTHESIDLRSPLNRGHIGKRFCALHLSFPLGTKAFSSCP